MLRRAQGESEAESEGEPTRSAAPLTCSPLCTTAGRPQSRSSLINCAAPSPHPAPVALLPLLPLPLLLLPPLAVLLWLRLLVPLLPLLLPLPPSSRPVERSLALLALLSAAPTVLLLPRSALLAPLHANWLSAPLLPVAPVALAAFRAGGGFFSVRGWPCTTLRPNGMPSQMQRLKSNPCQASAQIRV